MDIGLVPVGIGSECADRSRQGGKSIWFGSRLVGKGIITHVALYSKGDFLFKSGVREIGWIEAVEGGWQGRNDMLRCLA